MKYLDRCIATVRSAPALGVQQELDPKEYNGHSVRTVSGKLNPVC